MLTPKQNFLRATVEHKVPDWIPNAMADLIMAGGWNETFENGPLGGGFDGFGVEWHASQSAGGQAVPASGKYILNDITAWEDIVKFPDLDAYDWEGQAAAQLGNYDRSLKAVEYSSWNAHFLRLTHMMGFENALCSMYEEPEACNAFMEAVTDYKIGIVERVAEYFKPDIFTNFDDVATERGLFMSPDLYRTLIKPHHKRLNDAIKSFGIVPFIHTCGKCEEIIPDFIEEGAAAWTSAQPMNDLAGILKMYGDKIAVIGGYNTNGRPGMSDATAEEIDAEVKRVIDAYGPYGSFAIMGFRLTDSSKPTSFRDGLTAINEAVNKYGKNFYKN